MGVYSPLKAGSGNTQARSKVSLRAYLCTDNPAQSRPTDCTRLVPGRGPQTPNSRAQVNSIALIPAYKLLKKDYMNYLYLTKWLLTFHTELIYQLQNHGNLLRLTARKGLYRKVSGTNLHITTYGKPKSKQGRGRLQDCGLRYAPGWHEKIKKNHCRTRDA